ncbi:hypothetical protein CVT24_011135 [Panaeolus cyanescens]|uniref:Cyanovirin-N domain-containing protein n=1 Tax=Panaeolus cyanescens TaxID=181874 RepID=A0A409YGA8_9AGAR|nr:hypothetical protein CVT24_011135 [Panaeolus cyanescens]
MRFTSVLAITVTLANTFLGANARGEFSQSCTNYYIENNNFLRATCQNGQGGTTERHYCMEAHQRDPTGTTTLEYKSYTIMYFSNLLTLLATASALTLSAGARGGFASTCTNIFIENDHFLRATCGNGQGGTTSSSLDLNACIGISTGPGANLDCIPKWVAFAVCGNYVALGGCNSCLIHTGTFMRCHCPGTDRIADLDECVANNHGLLTCSF